MNLVYPYQSQIEKKNQWLASQNIPTEANSDSATDHPKHNVTESLLENKKNPPQTDLNVQLTVPSYHKVPFDKLKNMIVPFNTRPRTDLNHGTVMSKAGKSGRNRSGKYRNCWKIKDQDGIIKQISEIKIKNDYKWDTFKREPIKQAKKERTAKLEITMCIGKSRKHKTTHHFDLLNVKIDNDRQGIKSSPSHAQASTHTTSLMRVKNDMHHLCLWHLLSKTLE